MVSDDRLTVKATANGRNIVFCKQWIESTSKQITTWKLRVDRLPSNTYRSVVIEFITTGSSHAAGESYGISNLRQRIYQFNYYTSERNRVEQPVSFIEGDIVTLILDTKNRIILYQRDDEETQTIYRDIAIGADIQYRLRLNLAKEGNQITLIQFNNSPA